jgi:tetratricopeptide (TPR) repeat protein
MNPQFLPREPIVVVPFEVHGAGPELSGLGVRAATEISDAIARAVLGTVVPYAGGPPSGPGPLTRENVRQIVTATGAATLVTGTIYQHGDSLEVQTRLHRAFDLKPLWVPQAERGAANASAATIAAATNHVLAATAFYLSPEARGLDVAGGSLPGSLEQARLVLKASRRCNQTGNYDQECQQLWLDAVRADTTFFLAAGSLAEVYGNAGDMRRVDSIMRELGLRRGRMTAGEAVWYDYHIALRRSPEDEYRASVSLISIDSVNPVSQYQSMWSAHRANRFEETVRRFRRRDTTTAFSLEWSPWFRVAIDALHGLGRNDEALRTAREGRTHFPDEPSLLNAEAGALVAAGRLDDAEKLIAESYRYSGSMVPGELMANTIAPELYAHGKPRDAQAMWQKGLEWFSGRTLTGTHEQTRRLRVAQLTYVTGQYDKARPLYAELLKSDSLVLGPDSLTAELIAAEGLIDARLGDSLGARRVVERFLGDQTPWLRGGRLHWAALIEAVLGHKEEAVNLLRDALNHGERISWWHAHNPDWATLNGYPPFEELLRPKS